MTVWWMKKDEPEWLKSDDPMVLMEGALAAIEDHMVPCSDGSRRLGPESPLWRYELRRCQHLTRRVLKRVAELRAEAL